MVCLNYSCRQLRGRLHWAKLRRYYIAREISMNRDRLLADEVNLEDALRFDREFLQLLKNATRRAQLYRSRITQICATC